MRRILAFALMAICSGSGAAAFDISVEARMIGQTEWLTLSHDASTFNAVLGDPTSVLEYAPISSLWAGLTLSGRSVESTGFWFDMSAAMPVTGWGSFEDYDYYTGQILFSHTQSAVAMGQGITGSARMPVPFLTGVSNGNVTLRPYLTTSAESRHLSATGLACGVICGPLPVIPAGTTVIGHDLTGWQAGAGLWLETRLSETQTLDIRAELLGGRLGANDTHHLRADLGPAPHIAYDFQTIGAKADVTYTHALSNELALTIGAQAGLRNGTGSATFGTSMPTPIGTFDADFAQVTAGLSVGLKASF